MSRSFRITSRLKSFHHALRGIWTMLHSQHNAWIHLGATITVIAVGFYFSLPRNEWCFLVIAIIMVWMAEALNTAFEFLADVTNLDFHPLVKKAKDVAAGAVLISAVGAALIAMLIFVPKLRLLIDSAPPQ